MMKLEEDAKDLENWMHEALRAFTVARNQLAQIRICLRNEDINGAWEACRRADAVIVEMMPGASQMRETL